MLAAGRSSRMGQPKLLLPWGGTSILGHLVEQWRKLGAEQFAVVCAANSVLSDEMQRLGIGVESRVINPEPERGMFSSIQCAAQWTGWKDSLTHFCIVLGDQPHIPEGTLRRLLDLSTSAPDRICQPRQGGHRRHPVVMPRKSFNDISATKAASLKEFLDLQIVVYCDLDDPALALDINRMEDYERAKVFAEKKR